MVYIKLFFLIYIINVIKGNHTSFQNSHQLALKVTTDTNTKISENNDLKTKVNLSVYYEIMCPASVRFFTQQLRPVTELLAPYLDIQLIPYGHARTFKIRGSYEFRCQHGPAECYGNKLQACVLDSISNSTQAVLFNSCLLQYSTYRSNHGFNYNYIMSWCSYKHHTPVQGIIDCMHNGRASLLLKEYGDKTHNLRPQYVPFVVVDGSIDKQNDAAYDLISTVCKLLNPTPSACPR